MLPMIVMRMIMIAGNPMPCKYIYIYILIPPKKERFRIFLQRWMGFLLVCKGRPWQKQARYLLPTVLTLTSGWIWAVPATWGCKTGHKGAQQKSSIDQHWINSVEGTLPLNVHLSIRHVREDSQSDINSCKSWRHKLHLLQKYFCICVSSQRVHSIQTHLVHTSTWFDFEIKDPVLSSQIMRSQMVRVIVIYIASPLDRGHYMTPTQKMH